MSSFSSDGSFEGTHEQHDFLIRRSRSNRMQGLFVNYLGFQLQLDDCKYEVMITANVGTWERSCICFAGAGLEVLGRQDEVYLVVNLPIKGVPS